MFYFLPFSNFKYQVEFQVLGKIVFLSNNFLFLAIFEKLIEERFLITSGKYAVKDAFI